MKAQSWAWLPAAGVLYALCTGCATMHTRAEIPLGQWSGHGTCLLKEWPTGDHAATQPGLFKHQDYTTSLTIQPAPDGDAVRLEILTLRGKMPPLDGDRTHLIVDLQKRDTSDDGSIATYRVARFSLAFEMGNRALDEEPDTPPVTASCLALDGELILRIHYMEGFVDTFRFHGNRLYKDGTFFPKDGEGFVHWSEVLERQ